MSSLSSSRDISRSLGYPDHCTRYRGRLRPRVNRYLFKGPTRTPRRDWVARSRSPDGSKSRSRAQSSVARSIRVSSPWWIARRNATSADGPSRDSINQAVSVMTVAGTSSASGRRSSKSSGRWRDQDRRGRQRRIRRPCRPQSHVTRLLVPVLLADDFAVTPADRLAGTRASNASKAQLATWFGGWKLRDQLGYHIVDAHAATIRLSTESAEGFLGELKRGRHRNHCREEVQREDAVHPGAASQTPHEEW